MPSFANVNTTNLELTPVRVSFKGTDLGGTISNVKVTIKAMKADMKADQFGVSILNRKVSGHECTIETELVEINNKDNWKVSLPWASLITSGGNKQLYGTSQVGRDDLSDAGILILHPLSLPDSDLSRDFKFFKATVMGEIEPVYGPDQQVKLKVKWTAYLDTSVSPARMFVYGDPSIGVVHALVGSITYTGTGNGTLTGATADDAYTKTETITATCVTAAVNGGIFEVHGSLSGPLGLATVGTAFNAPSDEHVISFTINDGSTDFIVGDQFTIPTTGANYA